MTERLNYNGKTHKRVLRSNLVKFHCTECSLAKAGIKTCLKLMYEECVNPDNPKKRSRVCKYYKFVIAPIDLNNNTKLI